MLWLQRIWRPVTENQRLLLPYFLDDAFPQRASALTQPYQDFPFLPLLLHSAPLFLLLTSTWTSISAPQPILPISAPQPNLDPPPISAILLPPHISPSCPLFLSPFALPSSPTFLSPASSHFCPSSLVCPLHFYPLPHISSPHLTFPLWGLSLEELRAGHTPVG